MKNKLLIILSICLFLSACATIPIESNSSKKDLLALRDTSFIAYKNGQYQKALEGFNELVEIVPEDSELWFRKANTHARLYQTQEAIDAYQKALVRDPRHFKAWRNLSVIHLRQAVNSLTQLMTVLPVDHPLYDSSLLLTQKAVAVLENKSQQDQTAESTASLAKETAKKEAMEQETETKEQIEPAKKQ